MKKVKIMLLSLLVLAVAGGAMAFKAKFGTSYCTTATITLPDGSKGCPSSPGSCPIVNSRTTSTTGDELCYTTDLGSHSNCSGITSCTTKITLTTD